MTSMILGNLVLIICLTASVVFAANQPAPSNTNNTSGAVRDINAPSTYQAPGVPQPGFNSPQQINTQQPPAPTNQDAAQNQAVTNQPTTIDNNNTIREAQRALSRGGYNISADGVMGPATVDAIRSYQSKRGLTVNGILDAPTLNSLINTTNPQRAPSSVR